MDPQYYLRGSKTGAQFKRRNIEPAAGYVRAWERSCFSLFLELSATKFDQYWRMGLALIEFVVNHAAPLNKFIGFHFRKLFDKDADNLFVSPPVLKEKPPSVPAFDQPDLEAFITLYMANIHKPKGQVIVHEEDLTIASHPVAYWFRETYMDSDLKYLQNQFQEVTEKGRNANAIEWIYHFIHDFNYHVLPVIQHCSTDPAFLKFLGAARSGFNFVSQDTESDATFIIPNLFGMNDLKSLCEANEVSPESRALSIPPPDDIELEKGAGKGKGGKGGNRGKGKGGRGKSEGVDKATVPVDVSLQEPNVGMAPVRKMVEDYKGVFVANRHLYAADTAAIVAERLKTFLQVRRDAPVRNRDALTKTHCTFRLLPTNGLVPTSRPMLRQRTQCPYSLSTNPF